MASSLTGLTGGSTRRLLLRWQLLATASALAMLGIVFLAIAAYLWLANLIAPPQAAAVTAGMLLLAALAIVGVAAIVAACCTKDAPRENKSAPANLAEMTATLIDLSQKLDCEIKTSIKPLTIGALVIGCAIGYSPLLQRKLRELIG